MGYTRRRRFMMSGLVTALVTGAAPVPADAIQSASPTRTDYVAVGRDGTVGYTTDDGVTWAFLTPSRRYINGVASDNRGHFIAVGSGGLILRSTDGGAGWTPVPSGRRWSSAALPGTTRAGLSS